MRIKNIFKNRRISIWFCALLMIVSTSAQPVTAQVNGLDFTDINNQLYDPRCIGAAGSAETPLVGSDNQEKAFNFLTQKGLSEVQAAAIVGNFIAESGVNPKAVNSRSGAFGIAQWLGGRKDALNRFAAGPPARAVDDMGLQLDYFWHEVTETGEKAAMDKLEKETDIEKATILWAKEFERPSESELNQSRQKRIDGAKNVLNLYGGSTVTSGGEARTGVCRCEEGATGKVVVIDPGHSGSTSTETDPTSGIIAKDYPNNPEMQEVWDVSEKVRSALENDGFTVIMTKGGPNDTVGLLKRAQIANEAKAALAISIHNDHGQNFNSMKWVTPQEVGRYRESNGRRKTFDNAEVAQKSRQYADAFVETRSAAEGGGAQIHALDFPASRGLPASGNISIVQLFSQVPWVYHEVGGIGFDANKYAAGLIEGVKKALGNSEGGNCSGAVGNGDIVSTAIGYAWPTYRGSGYQKRTDAYVAAIDKARGDGKYIGGCNGVDCGGFVTRVMQDSNADPEYNDVAPGKGPVTSQEDYLKRFTDKYEPRGNITSPSQLQPGDIAIQFDRKHTFMFVGDQTSKGFQTQIASASLCDRAPMAGREGLSGNRWYRLVK